MDFRLEPKKLIVSLVCGMLAGLISTSLFSTCFDCPPDVANEMMLSSFVAGFIGGFILVYLLWSFLAKNTDVKERLLFYVAGGIAIIFFSFIIFVLAEILLIILFKLI